MAISFLGTPQFKNLIFMKLITYLASSIVVIDWGLCQPHTYLSEVNKKLFIAEFFPIF